MDIIPLDPALEALMPSTDNLMEIDVLSAPQNESRKRSIPLPDVAGPNPKNARKVKPRPKKAVKKKNQEPPEPPKKMLPIEEDHPPASVEANKPDSRDSSDPLPGSLPSSTPAETAQSSSEASAYQEEKLDASNHEHLKKMAGAHVEIAEVVKQQQLLLQNAMSAQQKTLNHLADKEIMNKDLTGADEDVKRYYSLKRKWILAQSEQEIATPAPAQGPTTLSSSAPTPAPEPDQ
ncbi:hypothetical protein PtB15_17B224 [Puccinia triticina]|nr:hypothetical protein PtB15_17B224 [Puccinia triticina]